MMLLQNDTNESNVRISGSVIINRMMNDGLFWGREKW